MLEFINGIIILLTICGWCLIACAAKDIFITARLGFNENEKNNKPELFIRSSGSWILKIVLRVFTKQKQRRFVMRNIGFIVPFSQYLMWKLMLVAGFGFLYLALDWQDINDQSEFAFFDEIFTTFWLSLSIFTRLAPYEFAPDRIGIHILANIQFYSGFVFYGFIFIYFMILRRRSKNVQPFLYRLKDELKKPYSPFNFSENLHRYGTNELSLILQDWEFWANDLRRKLKASPNLIYSRSRSENWSWLCSANIVLDATSAVIVTSDGTIKEQAKQTFSAVRRAVTDITDYLQIIPREFHHFPIVHNCPAFSGVSAEDVLSAEIIYEKQEENSMIELNEKLSVWQITYQNYLITLARHLEIGLPSQKDENSYERLSF